MTIKKILHWNLAFGIAGAVQMGAIQLSQVSAAPAKAAPQVTVTKVSAAKLKQAIQSNKGKVVIVNFWATWCAPCVAELPEFAQLQQASVKKGVKVLLVSADEPAQANTLVKKTLGQKGHRSSYLIEGGNMPRFFRQFDPNNKSAIALPLTYIYNRQGSLVKRVYEDHTKAEYEKMLAPYL